MIDLIVIAIILCIAAGAGYYIYRAKKRGASCIGCPCSGQCGKQHNGQCGGNCCSTHK